MTLEFNAKVVKALPLKSGVGQRGPWARATVVFEVQNGRHTEKIACENTVEPEAFSRLQPGQSVHIKADVSSREYQEKFYTSVVCYEFTVMEAQRPPQPAPAPEVYSGGGDPDLPF